MWSYSGSCDVMLIRNTWLIIKHSWQVKSTLWEVSGGRDFRWGGQDFIWLYWPQFFDVGQDVNPAEYLSQSCHWVPDHELLSNICQLTLVSSQHFRGERGGGKKGKKRDDTFWRKKIMKDKLVKDQLTDYVWILNLDLTIQGKLIYVIKHLNGDLYLPACSFSGPLALLFCATEYQLLN